jgi:fluoride exporter
MQGLILVAAGGAAGAVLRYLLGLQAMRSLGAAWPYGTFAANMLGGLAMGALAGWLWSRGGPDAERWRLLLGVGLLGGFTTFSAYSLELVQMLERRAVLTAGAYALGSVAASVGALWVGLLLARRVFA